MCLHEGDGFFRQTLTAKGLGFRVYTYTFFVRARIYRYSGPIGALGCTPNPGGLNELKDRRKLPISISEGGKCGRGYCATTTGACGAVGIGTATGCGWSTAIAKAWRLMAATDAAKSDDVFIRMLEFGV